MIGEGVEEKKIKLVVKVIMCSCDMCKFPSNPLTIKYKFSHKRKINITHYNVLKGVLMMCYMLFCIYLSLVTTERGNLLEKRASETCERNKIALWKCCDNNNKALMINRVALRPKWFLLPIMWCSYRAFYISFFVYQLFNVYI